MLTSLMLISAGASAGAVLRWTLGLLLNHALPHISLGTLAANLAGGFIMGLVPGICHAFPGAGHGWRLFVITGFLGSLTTFSAFSAEVVLLLHQQRAVPALASILLHVGGSLCMTLLGMAAFSLARRMFQAY
jgi:CrcB protein